MRSAQPETTQASQVEVPLGGLPPPVVALALRIRLLKFLYYHPDKRHTHIAELKVEIHPCGEIYNTNGSIIQYESSSWD